MVFTCIYVPLQACICVCLDIWQTVAILVSGMEVLQMVVGARVVGSCYKLYNDSSEMCLSSKEFRRPRSKRLWAPEE